MHEGRLEGRLEEKLAAIPRLLAVGLSIDQVAEALDLERDRVQQVAQASSH